MKPQRIKPIDTRKKEHLRTVCKIDGCTRPILGKGLCGVHFKTAKNETDQRHEA